MKSPVISQALHGRLCFCNNGTWYILIYWSLPVIKPWWYLAVLYSHYSDVVMGALASQITNLTIVYSTVYSDADQRKYQRPASLAFAWGSHRGLVISPHKVPVTRKMFPFDDVVMRNAKRMPVFIMLTGKEKALKTKQHPYIHKVFQLYHEMCKYLIHVIVLL